MELVGNSYTTFDYSLKLKYTVHSFDSHSNARRQTVFENKVL